MSDVAKLPSYKKPPINEVVIDIYFNVPRDFNSTIFGEVRRLFVEEYPVLREMPSLPPQLVEMFGDTQFLNAENTLTNKPPYTRLWFLNKNETELIQFQEDRFIRNWRILPDMENQYPRFRQLFAAFKKEAKSISQLFENMFDNPMNVAQCELQYRNVIEITHGDSIEKWIKGSQFFEGVFDVSEHNFVKDIAYEDDQQNARLYTNIFMNRKINELAINFRFVGSFGESLQDAFDFFAKGREVIVNSFDEITTDYAHNKWEKCK